MLDRLRYHLVPGDRDRPQHPSVDLVVEDEDAPVELLEWVARVLGGGRFRRRGFADPDGHGEGRVLGLHGARCRCGRQEGESESKDERERAPASAAQIDERVHSFFPSLPPSPTLALCTILPIRRSMMTADSVKPISSPGLSRSDSPPSCSEM